MKKQRLLVIGAGGFLGMYATRAAEATGSFEVIRAGRPAGDERNAEAKVERPLETVGLKISDAASVESAFETARPDCVLLLSAISDIDACQNLPYEAYEVNVKGAENVANACARTNARLLFTSSAAVFDGTKDSYSEEDLPAPLSVYGKTKLWGEMAIQEVTPSAVILRFALVLGFARRRGTNAMLDATMAKWKAGAPVSFSTREDRNPIDAATLGNVMIAMISDEKLSGVYHAGAADCVSRYELGLRLAARAGVSADLVRPQDEPIPGRAPRGQHHFLLTDKLRKACNLRPQSTDEVIERCFQ